MNEAAEPCSHTFVGLSSALFLPASPGAPKQLLIHHHQTQGPHSSSYTGTSELARQDGWEGAWGWWGEKGRSRLFPAALQLGTHCKCRWQPSTLTASSWPLHDRTLTGRWQANITNHQ